MDTAILHPKANCHIKIKFLNAKFGDTSMSTIAKAVDCTLHGMIIDCRL